MAGGTDGSSRTEIGPKLGGGRNKTQPDLDEFGSILYDAEPPVEAEEVLELGPGISPSCLMLVRDGPFRHRARARAAAPVSSIGCAVGARGLTPRDTDAVVTIEMHDLLASAG
jgi:hypothetical protein